MGAIVGVLISTWHSHPWILEEGVQQFPSRTSLAVKGNDWNQENTPHKVGQPAQGRGEILGFAVRGVTNILEKAQKSTHKPAGTDQAMGLLILTRTMVASCLTVCVLRGNPGRSSQGCNRGLGRSLYLPQFCIYLFGPVLQAKFGTPSLPEMGEDALLEVSGKGLCRICGCKPSIDYHHIYVCTGMHIGNYFYSHLASLGSA